MTLSHAPNLRRILVALGVLAALLVGSPAIAAESVNARPRAALVASPEKGKRKAPPKAGKTKPNARKDDKKQDKEDEDEEAEENGFMQYVYMVNQWYPLILDPELEPDVQSKIVPLWITTVFCGECCGALWIPMLIVGENPGSEYFIKEGLFIILAGFATDFVATLFSGTGTVIVPLFFIGLAGLALEVANRFYLSPVALINGYDRALKRERAKAAAPENDTGGSSKRKR